MAPKFDFGIFPLATDDQPITRSVPSNPALQVIFLSTASRIAGCSDQDWRLEAGPARAEAIELRGTILGRRVRATRSLQARVERELESADRSGEVIPDCRLTP